MTINRSIAKIVGDLASMNADHLTDAYLLELHCQHITAAGHLPGSVAQRRGAIRRLGDYIDPYSQDPRAVVDATTDQLAEWQANLGRLGRAASYVSSQVAHVRQYYGWLVRPMRIRPDSPADDLISPIVRKRLPRPIPEDDYEYALNTCSDPRVYAWLVLGGYAGLRGIDISDLDQQDLLLDDEIPFLRVRGKGDNEELIAVGREVIEALAPFRRSRRGPLFVSGSGARLRSRDIYERVNEFLARMGVPYTFHNCRHRYGSELFKITKDIRFTQKQMRHRSVASTEGYVAVPTEQAVSAMESLDSNLLERTHVRRRREDRSRSA